LKREEAATALEMNGDRALAVHLLETRSVMV
jgi:hypothetical protein